METMKRPKEKSRLLHDSLILGNRKHIEVLNYVMKKKVRKDVSLAEPKLSQLCQTSTL